MAVLLGLSPLVALELCAALAGWGEDDPANDPFVGFAAVQPLFELDDERRTYRVSPARRLFFAPEQFPAVKPHNGVRIFCLGGSTVQGNPYSIETSFTTWLEIALREIDPSRDWDVVNCGGVSYASYRLVPILKECLDYEPDLFIICTGHNEFLEDRTYGHLRQIPEVLHAPIHWVAHRRTVVTAGRMLERAGLAQPRQKAVLKGDADALLDYRNGLEAYFRDPGWASAVHRHFEVNLTRMVRIARKGNVPVIFVRPTSNLGEQPPFKSEHDAALPPDVIAECERLIARSRMWLSRDLSRGVSLLERACELDPLYAGAWYELGQCREALGDYGRAREAYIRARDEDVCPLRMTTPLEDALEKVARKEQVPLLDAHALLERDASHGILGGYWLVDHVHPSFEGHRNIAKALIPFLQAEGLVDPQGDWETRSRAAFASHFESLPRGYFHRGQRMLDALRKWTRGDPDGPPVERHFPRRIRGRAPGPERVP